MVACASDRRLKPAWAIFATIHSGSTTVKRQSETTAYLNVLVQEFRTWQILASLTIHERRLLVECDAPALIHLARQKEELLAGLSACQGQRMMLSIPHTSSPGGGQVSPDAPHDQTLSANLILADAGCLLQITQGIQALADRIGELVRGNYALAGCASRHLLGLPAGVPLAAQPNLPALLAAVLAAGDQASLAIGLIALPCEAAPRIS